MEPRHVVCNEALAIGELVARDQQTQVKAVVQKHHVLVVKEVCR